MAKTKTLDQLLDDVLAREGGFVDHRQDRGGPTKYGITAVTLGEWRGLGRRATREEVQKLAVTEARELYRRRYWEGPQFDVVAALAGAELAALLFDYGAHSGPAAAIRDLQRALQVPADGLIGPVTQAALVTADAQALYEALLGRRAVRVLRIVKGDPTQQVFLEGWMNRLVEFA